MTGTQAALCLGNAEMEQQMRFNLARIGLAAAALTAISPLAAKADSYWDLESARANARAGGPVSEHDAELLERYGCLSGTRSAFCERLNRGDRATERVERRRQYRTDER